MTQAALIPAAPATPPTTSDVLAQKATRRPNRQPHPYLHLASNHPRGVRARWCQDCRAPILTGVDEDWCAGTVHVDTTPLSAIGEVTCLLGGRRTYSLDGEPARLTTRKAGRIGMQPAGKPRRTWHKYDVLPAHQCGNPITENLVIASMLKYIPPKRIDANEPAPF